ncbi:MAG: nuclear transport factor 2 family protein [Oscillospiraceae bacterium]|nr:nuclear transport factor 2 family protein [Oscillospiraceae bacterium]
MESREQTIRDCLGSWVAKDAALLGDCFAFDAIYVESWGPAYRNLEQIMAWFTDWNKENHVLKWNIKQFLHVGDTCVCEWYFEYNCGGNIDGFNGVSLITFDDLGKIVLLKEFQSKTPNHYPYS